MELTWSLDYCLACDKQTDGETYCSQSCRLADLETSSNWSGPTTPTTSSWPTSDSHRGSAFYLTPAINFAAYKASKSSSQSSSQTTSPTTSYFPTHTSSEVAATKTLTPSSSSSSLNSTKSNTSSQAGPLSEQTRSELRGYTDSFDNTRNWRRRMTWS